MNALSARALATLVVGWRGPGVAYQALADRIRLLILDGRIASGTRLPAERELATQLAVSRTTVSTAYATLRDDGYLTSLRGSGSVARLPRRAPAPLDTRSPDFIDFSKATMAAIPEVANAARIAAEKLPGWLGESGFDPFGISVLREAVADRYTARGLATTPDQIMITVGAQHGIALVARTIMARGDRALIEHPTFPHAIEALKMSGARLVPVSVTTDEGWDETAIAQAIQRTSPSIGYLMPDNHNPTGRTMPEDQRERVIAMAARQGTTLIIDETMAELGFSGAPQPLPFAAHGPAILVGSVGKTVWGGLRIGWVRADRSVIQRIARARSAGDLGTPLLDQLLVAELLHDFEPILQARRATLRAGRDRLVALLSEHFPEWTVPVPDGGLTLWVNLGEAVSSSLALASRAQGLIVAAGPRFGIDGAFERFLRLPFSVPADDMVRGVDALSRAWHSIGAHHATEMRDDLAII